MDNQKTKWAYIEYIYEEYEDDVYKTCLYFAKDEHIAGDMTQKTFFSVYEHFETLRPGSVKPYLIRTARNITLNFLRDFKRLREGQIDDLNDENLKILSVEEMYVRKESEKYAYELSNNIMECLYKKNKRWHELVMLAYYFDIPQDDIAEQMGVGVEIIYSRLYRAKQWIRKHYREEYELYLKLTEG